MFKSLKTVLLHPLKSFYYLRDAFWAGPDWTDLPGYLERPRSGYKSPTLLIIVWVYAWYMRLFTVPGRMIVTASVLILLYGVVVMDGPGRTFAFLMGSVLFVDFLIGRIFAPHLKIIRKVPERVRAGSDIEIEYVITNLGTLSAWNIHLDPVHQQGWLVVNADIATVESIPPGSTITANAFLHTNKRGEYILKPAFASSSFPFGIVKATCRNRKPQRILVYPAYEELNSVSLPVNSRFQKRGVSLVSNVGESTEFHACREFRTGDNPRHIHWPTTARKNELIVREYQEEFLCRIALIVDTYIPEPTSFFGKRPEKNNHPPLEAALSLTAALSHYLANGDYIVDIFAAGPEVYHLKGGRSLAQFDQILDILACVEPSSSEPLRYITPALMEDIAAIGSAMLLLLSWDQARENLVHTLRSYGITVKVIILSSETGDLPDIPGITAISPEDVFSGNIKNL